MRYVNEAFWYYVNNLYANNTQKETETWWTLQDVKIDDKTKAAIEEVTGRVPVFMSQAIKSLPKWVRGLRDTYDRALNFSKLIEKQYLKDEEHKVFK